MSARGIHPLPYRVWSEREIGHLTVRQLVIDYTTLQFIADDPILQEASWVVVLGGKAPLATRRMPIDRATRIFNRYMAYVRELALRQAIETVLAGYDVDVTAHSYQQGLTRHLAAIANAHADELLSLEDWEV